MRRSRFALLVALGVDSFGSGLFLPLTLVYVTEAIGLPLNTAGVVVTAGTALGLLVPPVAGRLVDRVGPRLVVIVAQLVQAAGAVAYLVADGVGATVLAAATLAAGQQTFYSSLFALIADVSTERRKDRSFAIADMVRGGAFGLGGLVIGGVLATAGAWGYRAAVAFNAVSFLVCAVLLATMVRTGPTHRVRRADAGGHSVLRDRAYLGVIGATALVGLAGDFFLVGLPVFARTQLHLAAWVPGAAIALLTVVTATGAAAAVRATAHLRRTSVMALGAGLYLLWCPVAFAAVFVPPGWRTAYLLAATTLVAAAAVVFGTRANAVAEAAAPPAARGRYLAAFQYAFTTATAAAPVVAGLFVVATWLPWLVVAGSAAAACAVIRVLAHRLPASAL